MKKLLLTISILVLIGISNLVTAQAPDWEWAKSFGGTSHDYGKYMVSDAAGNLYVAGEFSSPTINFGTTTLIGDSSGVTDIFIVKYDNNGVVLWAKSGGGSWYDGLRGMAIDSSGNVILTGYFGSASITFGAYTLVNTTYPNKTDVFMVKYDTNGNLIWVNSIGGTGSELVNDVAIDNYSNVYLMGIFFSDSIIIGSTVLKNIFGYTGYLAKYDENGNVLWAKIFGGLSFNFNPRVIATDVNRDIIITGIFEDTITIGTSTLINTGNVDVFIAKLDEVGNASWAISAGGNEGEFINNITTDPLGNIYITGVFESDSITFGTTTLKRVGTQNVFTAKYNSNGNLFWAKGSALNYSYSNSMAVDAKGNVTVVGYFSNRVTFGAISLHAQTSVHGKGDGFVINYDSSGNEVWAKRVGGYYNDNCLNLFIDAKNNIYVIGFFYSATVTLGSTILSNTATGNADIFIAKLAVCNSHSTINKNTCNNYLSPSGNYVWTTSGIYYDTIPNTTGCDSIIRIKLTINETSSLQNIGTCNSIYTSPSGNYIWSVTGTYYDTIPNSKGCDSVMTINLVFNNSTTSIINITACNSFTSPSGKYIWATSGTYFDTIPNATGCDSIITIDLIINTGSASSQTITNCFNYISPSGNHNWTTSGIYFDTIPNSVGCDSVITIDLTITAVNTTVTQTGNVLSANASGAAYQWLDCNNNFAIIAGETNPVFAPTAIGIYAAAITWNGCIDTTACYAVIGTGLNELNTANGFEISPNPALNEFKISSGQFANGKTVTITITDVTGKLVYTGTTTLAKTTINISHFIAGVYAVKIQAVNFIETKKLIIEK